ncbi:cupin domain-containing protein [Brevibacillus laterosporus]
MAISYMDYTSPSTQFTYDLNNNPIFRKDSRNYINELSIMQLNTLGNASLLDIFLSISNIVEPHYHQNASELVYCISGSAVVSLINPFTNELLNFPITPGQVANVPQGWWHYEIATVDNTHLLAIFDAPIPETIFGSDILRLTPPSILAHTYCLNEAKVKDTLAPIQSTVVIGPLKTVTYVRLKEKCNNNNTKIPPMLILIKVIMQTMDNNSHISQSFLPKKHYKKFQQLHEQLSPY